jgi:hypothetical protein
VPDDREIARRSLDLQARARDYALVEIPTYQEWSERKLEQGESDAFIAHLDAMSMSLLPEEVATVNESDFEELRADLKEQTAKSERRYTP